MGEEPIEQEVSSEDLKKKTQESLDLLKKEREASVDQLAVLTEIPLGKLLAALMKLEMKKLITQLPGKRFTI